MKFCLESISCIFFASNSILIMNLKNGKILYYIKEYIFAKQMNLFDFQLTKIEKIHSFIMLFFVAKIKHSFSSLLLD